MGIIHPAPDRDLDPDPVTDTDTDPKSDPESESDPLPAPDQRTTILNPSSPSTTAPGSRPDPMPCPLCAGDGRRLFVAHGYPVLDCCRCHHRFAGLAPADNHVATVYDDSYFDGGGAGYDDYLAEGGILTAHGRRYADLLAGHGINAGRVLDIGASCGFIMKGLASRGWNGIGLEPNATMATRGRALTGIDIRIGTAEGLPAAVTPQPQGPGAGAAAAADDSGSRMPPEGSFDLISLVQVIAHFHDPKLALSRLRARTRPGGWWLIETWDHASLSARLAGRHWHEYSPPSVLHWFTRNTLTALLADYGLKVVAHGKPRKYLRGSHARSLLEHKLAHSGPGRLLLPLTRRIPESAAIPYPANDLFWLLCRCD